LVTRLSRRWKWPAAVIPSSAPWIVKPEIVVAGPTVPPIEMAKGPPPPSMTVRAMKARSPVVKKWEASVTVLPASVRDSK
jgi:hypothetical protein